MKRTAAALAIAVITLCLAIPVLSAESVTLCHAAGLDDTTHFVTLTIGESAAYGPAGHFYLGGTHAAGHERDYLGPCAGDGGDEDSTTTTTVADTTTTTAEVVTTTTAAQIVTTTTMAVTTTTLPVVTTTTVIEEFSPETQPDHDDSTTTTTLQYDETPSVVAGLTVTVAAPSDSSKVSALTINAATSPQVAMTELPFTGIGSGVLAAVALGLAAAGTFMLKFSARSIPAR
ncbi:MAG: hypothetical protein H0U53_00530 [Actinobacteria bacterium]|nr:hypothetical protein [Actinomycetota bacterium]